MRETKAYAEKRNTTNPDNSGIFKFLADELQDAECKVERVWVVGHVLSGWDGSNPLPNPTGRRYPAKTRGDVSN